MRYFGEPCIKDNNRHKEKDTLQDTVNKLQSALSILRDKENDTCDKVKRSLDVAEQAHYEKHAAEAEIRRLKDELERQHLKLRDAIADQGRRIAEERSAVERRYTQQIEQLTAEVGVQWETTNKLQLELDKQRRENSDLRREVAQKQALIDELKKEMQSKLVTLQTDIGVTGAEKSALEQQISTLQMTNERNERQLKQEIARLQAEIQSLRQRLDRADVDLIHSRRENIRLTEQIASLEKEVNLNAALSEERSKTPRNAEIVALPPPSLKKEDREKELTSMVQDMESKHAATVAELESMIYSQNQLMDKLSSECQALTQKLEDASIRHKEEIRELQTSLKYLDNRFSQSQLSTPNITDEEHPSVDNKKNVSPPTRNPNQQEGENLSRSSSSVSIKQNLPSTKDSQDIPQYHHQPQQDTKTIGQRQQNLPSTKDSQDTPQYHHQPQQDTKTIGQKQTISKDQQRSAKQPPPSNDTQQQEYRETGPGHYEDILDQQYTHEQYNPDAQYNPNETYMNQGYDLNQEYDPSQQYDPNQDYGPGEGYDPNQQYEQYEGDPSQQYAIDHNDPNQQYAVDSNPASNVQYSTEPGNNQYPPGMDPNISNPQFAIDPINSGQYVGDEPSPEQ
ncbi:hypothetical protein NQ317_004020 [Molorchus minor]|uniref:Uncharacterized protein n=1 Tax=Molorchus minor TaxID=1323400 RepID=A0ABQ9JTR6_9CUCU|nr:hypothetical protein NQ317_004020 [Molorchus minor]